MARPPVAVVGAAAAAGTALYYLIKSRRNLAGSWYSVAKATGLENGDQYEFRYEGGVYKIYRGGHNEEEDQFKVVGDKIQHVDRARGSIMGCRPDHGPTATLLPSGELHWDIDNGNWLSRKKGVAPAVVRTLARLFVRSPSWPPAHAPVDAVHFSKLRSEGGVKQVWLILKHDGCKCKPDGGVELATVTCHLPHLFTILLCSNLRGSVLLLLSCLAFHRSLASDVRLQMCSTTSPTGRTKRTSTTAMSRSTLGHGR